MNMSLTNSVNKFNDCIEEMLIQLYNCIDDTDLDMYASMFRKLKKINATKAIEQFIIYALPYKDKIINEDETFFLNHDEASLIKNDSDTSIMKALKFKQIWKDLSQTSKMNLFKFFQVLVYYAEEYFKIKYNHLLQKA